MRAGSSNNCRARLRRRRLPPRRHPGRRCRSQSDELTKGRETGPSALGTGRKWKGWSAFQVRKENIDATFFIYDDFSICTQLQTGSEFFALVESIRGD